MTPIPRLFNANHPQEAKTMHDKGIPTVKDSGAHFSDFLMAEVDFVSRDILGLQIVTQAHTLEGPKEQMRIAGSLQRGLEPQRGGVMAVLGFGPSGSMRDLYEALALASELPQ
jgi:hypothetical protein